MTGTGIVTTKTIKENSHYRITQLWNQYFLDGKNSFGRWVTMQTLGANEVEETWRKAEQKASEL